VTETSIITDLADNLYIVFISNGAVYLNFFSAHLTFMVSESYYASCIYSFNPRLLLSLNSEGPTPITGQAAYDFSIREQITLHLVYP